MPKLLRIVALVLAALALTMTSAHVLELPQKAAYDPWLYAVVNGSLYRWFAIVGGTYTVLAILAAWALAWTARSVPAARRPATLAAVLLTLALVSWALVVAPINREAARAAAALDAPERLPALWSLMRARWEGGHVLGFVLQLLGFVALATAAVADVPARAPKAVHATASMIVRAPASRLFALYTDWRGWARLFPRTIRGTRLVSANGGAYGGAFDIEVDHREGPVPNLMSVVSPELVVLDERKRRYLAHFVNRFEPISEVATRYVVTADVTLLGALRWLRFLAAPIIRWQIRRFVLDPMRRAAEAT